MNEKEFRDNQIERDEMPVNSESLYVKKCIRTFSGKYINVFDPNPDDILIEDIAHALSNQPRFGGHLPGRFYSVAQHSIECYKLAIPEEQFAALMHDSSEAYLLDMPKPIKLEIAQYNTIEDKLMKVIAAKFGFEYPKSKGVDEIDGYMLQREWHTLMLNDTKYFDPFEILDHEQAKDLFLAAFEHCKNDKRD